MSKHTPGPWVARTDGDDEMPMRTVHGLRSAGGDEVCIVTTGSYNDDVEAANARLIAAAPELYEALLNIVEAAGVFCKEHGAPESPHIAAARAAIAKAEGA